MSEPTIAGRKLFGTSRIAYIACLEKEKIPLKSRPYYATRLNQFLHECSCLDPASLNQELIEHVFTVFGRREDLLDWQYAQLVDAVRIYVVCFLKSQAARGLD